MLYDAFSSVLDVLYIPGAKRLVFTTSEKKTFIFSLQKNIEAQIAQLNLLKTNLKNYDKVKEIDLGSMSDVIVKY